MCTSRGPSPVFKARLIWASVQPASGKFSRSRDAASSSEIRSGFGFRSGVIPAPAILWNPPGKPRAPFSSPFDSLRSLRTTSRFSGGIPSEWPRAAGGRVEGSSSENIKEGLKLDVYTGYLSLLSECPLEEHRSCSFG